mgnify:CR=1 FL=1
MVNQDPEFVSEVLLNQIHNVKAGLLSAYPKNGLKDQLISGTRYNGNGSVEAFLSYHPNSDAVSYTHLTLPTTIKPSRGRWSR